MTSQDKRKVKVFGTPDVAKELGMKDASVRKLVIQLNAEGKQIGTKVTERAWIFTPEEVEVLRTRDDRRGDWQKDGGRQRYLEEKKQERPQRDLT